MRTATIASSLTWLVMSVAAPVSPRAQERDTLARDSARIAEFGLPRSVVQNVVDRYNAPAALRASGSLEIPGDQVVAGDVAVLNGPLTVGGRVRGTVVAVNADVFLERGARIDGDLFVVGGVLEGDGGGTVGGEIVWHREALAYHLEGERIVADRDAGAEEGRMRRWVRRYERSMSKIRLTSDGAYNRVEGLPILLGPSIRARTAWGRIRFDAYGILRTANDFAWDSDYIGHDVTGELQLGRGRGLAVGARAFDVVSPVEEWQLRDSEVGLASFLLRRDFRDYYNRHGGQGYLRMFVGGGDGANLTLAYGEERWAARSVRDPFSLFRNGDSWRANPWMDEGRLRLANATLTVDTRNDEQDPWTGWFITADVERGASDALRLAPTSPRVRTPAPQPTIEFVAPQETDVEYTRGFLDLRRYNRVSTEGQLNFRLVLGGWLSGDPLPLQRRFSLGGPGSLPGYDFRNFREDHVDMLTCNTPGYLPPDGRPAQCERIALAQVEYRGDLKISIGRGWDEEDEDRRDRWSFDYHPSAQWVVFADAGRGWIVNSAVPSDVQVDKDKFPSPRHFRTDVGVGLDFDAIGFFIAKSTSNSDEPANFFVRLRHRF